MKTQEDESGRSMRDRDHRKQEDDDNKAIVKEGELVKHMSNLPTFLKKSHLKDSFLNVGVLDWARVQEWKRDRDHLNSSFSLPGEESQNSSLLPENPSRATDRAPFRAILNMKNPPSSIRLDQKLGSPVAERAESAEAGNGGRSRGTWASYVGSISGAVLRAHSHHGYPFYTFSVEDGQVLLAGAMEAAGLKREGSVGGDHAFSLYSVRERKKIHGRWSLCSGRERARHYTHNPVAQLNVSSSSSSSPTRSSIFAESSCSRLCCGREYVLLPVGAQQNELAAIVIDSQGLCRTRMEKADQETASTCRVLLPGGEHSLLSNQCPSSLIQRWKSGGSCDCGGWDLGCQIKILVDRQNQASTGRSSHNASSMADKLELSLQGEEDGRLFFSFFSIDEHTCSVQFDSSLSPLQAFSICVAARDSKIKLWNAIGCGYSADENKYGMGRRDGIWASGAAHEVASRFISFPPPSPVGRV